MDVSLSTVMMFLPKILAFCSILILRDLCHLINTLPKQLLVLKPSLFLRGGDKDVAITKPQLASQADSGPQSTSPYEYVPVTTLDDYGQSTQLKHAMKSASRYGTPVLACLCCTDEDDDKNKSTENAIIVCSLQRPRWGIIATPHEANGIIRSRDRCNVHPSIHGMVKMLATRDDSTKISSTPRHSLHTALVSTGLQSDVSFLLRSLQSHLVSKYWLRYDSLPHGEVILRMIREILQDFLGYDWSEEVGSSVLSGGIGSAAASNNEDEESSRAGRPLGVCMFLLELVQIGSGESPSLTVIQANGSSDKYMANAMGIGSELGNKRLSQKWRRGMSAENAKEMLRRIFKEVSIEQGWLSVFDKTQGSCTNNAKSDSGTMLRNLGESYGSDLIMVCETVTRNGISIEYFKL